MTRITRSGHGVQGQTPSMFSKHHHWRCQSYGVPIPITCNTLFPRAETWNIRRRVGKIGPQRKTRTHIRVTPIPILRSIHFHRMHQQKNCMDNVDLLFRISIYDRVYVKKRGWIIVLFTWFARGCDKVSGTHCLCSSLSQTDCRTTFQHDWQI